MLFEELKNKYPNAQLSLYGDCIIIPISYYTKEKEKQLQAEGHINRITDYQFKEVWAVSLKRTEPYHKEPFPEPPQSQAAIKSANASKADWTDEDKDRLMKRWVEVAPVTVMEKAREILKEFPGRSAQAIYLMHYQLTGGKTTHQRKPKEKQSTPTAPPKPAAAPTENHTLQVPVNPAKLAVEVTNQQPKEITTEQQHIDILMNVVEELSEKIGEIKEQLADLETRVEFLTEDFKEHEHSERTGLPRVPP